MENKAVDTGSAGKSPAVFFGKVRDKLRAKIRGAAESCALAESLRRTAERLMAPFAVPDDFCFRGVRG